MEKNLLLFLIFVSSCIHFSCNNVSNNNENSNNNIPPDSPENVTLIAAINQIEVSFDTVDHASEYSIYWDTISPVTKESNIISTLNNKYVHGKLTSEHRYYYAVSSSNSLGESKLSEEKSTTPLSEIVPVKPPSNFNAEPGDKQNTLTFTPSPGATTYTLYWTTQTPVTKDADTILNIASPYVNLNLTNGTTYYYAITASNANGESDLSNEVNATPHEFNIAIEWQRSYGGKEREIVEDIQLSSDGGYIFAGYTESSDGDVTDNHGNRDFWIVKLNSNGDIAWQKTIGGTDYDYLESITETSDGEFIVVGLTRSSDGDVTGIHESNDYWIVKLTSIGSIIWQKCFGGSLADAAQCVQETNSGDFLITGYAGSKDGDIIANHEMFEYCTIKLSSTGDLIWQKSYGGDWDDVPLSLQATSDSGCIIAGYSGSDNGDITAPHGSTDGWVIKLDTKGGLEWQKCYGGSNSDAIESIQNTPDGGYVFAATTESADGDVSNNFGDRDYWVVKINSVGTIEWGKVLGGIKQDYADAIQVTSDGGFIVAGYSYSSDGQVSSNNGNSDFWIVKLSSSGAIEWEESFGGSGYDQAKAIKITPDGGCIIAGYSDSNDGDVTGNHGNIDCWIVKLKAM